MLHVTRRALAFVATLGGALALMLAHVGPTGAQESEANITIDFTADCTGFTATSDKDISHVEVDGEEINVNSPTYTDAQGGDEIGTVLVKSGTTSVTETCGAAAEEDGEEEQVEAAETTTTTAKAQETEEAETTTTTSETEDSQAGAAETETEAQQTEAQQTEAAAAPETDTEAEALAASAEREEAAAAPAPAPAPAPEVAGRAQAAPTQQPSVAGVQVTRGEQLASTGPGLVTWLLAAAGLSFLSGGSLLTLRRRLAARSAD